LKQEEIEGKPRGFEGIELVQRRRHQRNQEGRKERRVKMCGLETSGMAGERLGYKWRITISFVFFVDNENRLRVEDNDLFCFVCGQP